MVSNAAAKGKTVNECQCTMSSWKSQCVGKSMLLADTLLGAQEWLLWSRGAYGAKPAERGRERWVMYRVNKDGD